MDMIRVEAYYVRLRRGFTHREHGGVSVRNNYDDFYPRRQRRNTNVESSVYLRLSLTLVAMRDENLSRTNEILIPIAKHTLVPSL